MARGLCIARQLRTRCARRRWADELTTTTSSTVWVYADGSVVRRDLDPLTLGRTRGPPFRTWLAETQSANAQVVRDVVAGQPGPIRDVVVLNAAAALGRVRQACAGAGWRTTSPTSSNEHNRRSTSGAAQSKLQEWIAVTHPYGDAGHFSPLNSFAPLCKALAFPEIDHRVRRGRPVGRPNISSFDELLSRRAIGEAWLLEAGGSQRVLFSCRWSSAHVRAGAHRSETPLSSARDNHRPGQPSGAVSAAASAKPGILRTAAG